MTAEHPRPQRVLIVDDDARLVFVMQEVLGDAGYETNVEDDSQALDLGAAVKLTKPFTLEQLLDGVAVALAPA